MYVRKTDYVLVFDAGARLAVVFEVFDSSRSRLQFNILSILAVQIDLGCRQSMHAKLAQQKNLVKFVDQSEISGKASKEKDEKQEGNSFDGAVLQPKK